MLLLNKFKRQTWIKLSAAQRQNTLQKLENKMARRVGRPPLPISIITDPNWYCYGMFEVKNGKEILHLNISLIYKPSLRFQALATVLHEGRHATQHFIITHDPAWFQLRAKRWNRNMNNYISSNTDKNLYQMQEVERDAQSFVLKKLRNWQHKFETEDDFILTITALKKSFTASETKAKEQYGKFYRSKINRAIKKNSKK